MGIIVLIYVGAVRVNMGSLTQGEVVALVNYMSQILVELVKLANLIITVTKAAACGKRIEAVLAIKPEMQSGSLLYTEEKRIPAVEFSNVSLTYKKCGSAFVEQHLVSGNAGETIGIIGGTGLENHRS